LVYDLTSLHLPDLRDGLTGLYGRAYLEAALERELRQGAREQYPVVVLLAAPDQFQRINRTLGQAAGEALLHALGNFFSMRTRGEDMACHYAGEKFALVLPGATPEAVRRFVEQLQSNLKHLRVRHHDRALDPLTLSFGVAVFPEHGATGAAVLGAAEAALDRARRAGRERVVVGGAAAAITGAAEDEGDEDGGGDEDGDVPLA
jgi:diguanylate cyclase (GGDEF)-like protein